MEIFSEIKRLYLIRKYKSLSKKYNKLRGEEILIRCTVDVTCASRGYSELYKQAILEKETNKIRKEIFNVSTKLNMIHDLLLNK